MGTFPENYFRQFRVKDLLHVISDKTINVHVYEDNMEVNINDTETLIRVQNHIVTGVAPNVGVYNGLMKPTLCIYCTERKENKK